MKQNANKPTVEQLVDFLPQGLKDNMHELIEACGKRKMTPRWYATNSFNIKYKGKVIFRFRIFEDGIVDIYFTVSNRTDLDGLLGSLSNDMRKFYFTNLRLCSHCNPAHGNGCRIQILGNEYDVCAEPEMFIKNPSKEQIVYLIKFIDIRRGHIGGIGG